jgi:hypothetical protein
MPTYKPELTPREQRKYLSIARELEAAGTRVDIPDEWRENERFLRITIAGSPESLITQFSPSKVLYAFRVRLLAERSGIVQGFEVETCWDHGVFSCYPEGRPPYRFGPGLDFDFDEVLNHRIESLLRFRRGDVREGWLLAMGNKPIPEEYGPGRPAPLKIVLFDQFSQPHAESGEFLVERSVRTIRSAARPRTSLFAPENTPDVKERVTGKTSWLPESVSRSFRQSGP